MIFFFAFFFLINGLVFKVEFHFTVAYDLRFKVDFLCTIAYDFSLKIVFKGV